MPQTIDIPRVGPVEFPDSMSDADIISAIETDILPKERARRREELISQKAELEAERDYATFAETLADRSFDIANAIRYSNPLQVARTTAHMIGRAFGLPGTEAPIQDPGQGIPFRKPEGESVLAGVGRFAATLGDFLTSPEGVALAATGQAPAIARAATHSAIAGHMAAQVPETSATLGEATVTGTPADVTEQALHLAMETGIAGAAPLVKAVRAEPKPDVPTTKPAQEPLGLMREERIDPSLQKLSEDAFDAYHRDATKEVDRLEKKYDAGTLTESERSELGLAQDKYASAQLERYRRNILDLVPEDLFRKLRQVAKTDPNKSRLLLNEMERQGLTAEDVVATVRLRSPDEAEVFKGQLEDIKRLTLAPEPVSSYPGAIAKSDAKSTDAFFQSVKEMRDYKDNLKNLSDSQLMDVFLDTSNTTTWRAYIVLREIESRGGTREAVRETIAENRRERMQSYEQQLNAVVELESEFVKAGNARLASGLVISPFEDIFGRPRYEVRHESDVGKPFGPVFGAGKDPFTAVDAANRYVATERGAARLAEKRATAKISEPEASARTAEPPRALGISESVSRSTAAKLREWMVPRSAEEGLPITLDATTAVPFLQPYEVAQSMATTAHGIGKVPGLAYLFDPRSVNRGYMNDAILTRQMEVEIGNAVSIALGKQIEGKYERIFGVDAQGRVRGVQIPESESPFISDFFERLQRDPNAYRLTDEQWQAFQEIELILDQAHAFRKHHNLRQRSDHLGELLGPEETDVRRPWFRRTRIFTPEEQAELAVPSRSGVSVGARQPHEKPRLFDTEAEGVAAGIVYEPTIYKRLDDYVRQLYRIAADERIADRLSPLGETYQQRLERYRSEFPDVPESKIEQLARDPRPSEGMVNQPAFVGLIFPSKVSNVLNDFYSTQRSKLRQALSDANQGLKGLTFGFDFGGPFLQGQVLLANDPVGWVKSVDAGLRAFVDPQSIRRRMEDPENVIAMRELAQLGVPLGRLAEFMPGDRVPPFIERIKIGQFGAAGIWKRFQRFQNTFLESGVVELWKAGREGLPPTELAAFAETLQNAMMTGRMEGIGLSPNRVLAERSFFLAPAFLRGGVGIVAALGEKGASGAFARRALGRWAVGGLLVYYGSALLSEMDQDEIVRRLNPAHPDFAMIRVKTDEGRELNIGFGGILRSLIRLMGEVGEALIEDKSRLVSPDMNKNVFGRWLRGKLAPVPSTVTDMVIGKDFLGNDVGWKHIIKRQAPIMLQDYLVEEGEPIPPAGEIVPGSLGLFMFPESERKQFSRRRDALAHERFGSAYESLPFTDQWMITSDVQAEPPFNLKRPVDKRIIALAIDKNEERKKTVHQKLGNERMRKLEELGLAVTGYKPSIRIGGLTVPLTDKQVGQFEDLIVSEFSKSIDKFLASRAVEIQDSTVRQEILSKVLEQAREAARKRFIASTIKR